ncbi:MAG: hypothetical protein FWD75_01475 [Propionibacteriaceae bacterium]|nr:hypothetical protein [Propionibacteriaceae bacterium]
MKTLVTSLTGAVLLIALAGCTGATAPDPTVPPIQPTHRIAGSTLPQKVAGYTALGPAPTLQQMTATYARDAQPLDLAVVTFDTTGDFGTTTLTKQQWYGASRCGLLWQSDAKVTPTPTQVACITVLTDGVMTTVSGGQQTPQDMASLANAIYEVLS